LGNTFISIIKHMLCILKNDNCQLNTECVLEGLGFVTNFKSEDEKNPGEILCLSGLYSSIP